MRKRVVIMFAAVAILAGNALAQDFPAEEKLKTIQQKMEGAKGRQKELFQQTAKQEKELSRLQQELVALAARVQVNEHKLSATEQQLQKLVEEEAIRRTEFEQRSEELASSVNAMVRLSIVPPEALLAMPGESKDTIRTAKALGSTMEALHGKAEELKRRIEELHTLRTSMEELRRTLREEQEGLERGQQDLGSRLGEHTKIYRQLHADLDAQNLEVATLSKESSSLQELIDRLERQRLERLQRLRHALPVSKPKDVASLPESGPTPPTPPEIPQRKSSDKALRALGKGRMLFPAQGKIIHRFGETLEKNNTSKGIRIVTRNHAQVVSPYDGEVVYSGPFMSYGNILIIRHDGNFHSLVAGMEKINAQPGQFVLEGEPIGVMGTKESGKAELYMELRRESKPVDPIPWLKS